MRYLSVCSGIEAASVAWKPLGWKPVAFAENEAFPCAVLKHHYPDVRNFGDVNRWKDWPHAAFDVLVGGTPCQSFSVAGLRGGMADPRGNLALVYLAIADRYRPEWLVWENVPGVLSSNEGRDFAAFIGGLEQLGYHAAWRVLDAQYVRVDGFARAVPQRRRRVFVVGHLGDWRRAAAVLFEREGMQGHPAPRRQAGERVAPTIGDCSNGGGANGPGRSADSLIPQVANPLTHRMHKGINTTMDEGQTMVAHTLDAFSAGRATEDGTGRGCPVVAHSLKADGFDASEDGTGRGTPLVPIAFSAKDHGGDAEYDLSPTLRAGGFTTSHANAGVMPAIAFDARQSDVIQYGDMTGPLDTDGHTMAVAFDITGTGPNMVSGGTETDVHTVLRSRAPGHSEGSTTTVVSHGWAVRRLLPVECEKLQGFPPGYTAVPYRGKPAADGPRYKALGNSMAVNCMRWLGRRIEMAAAA